MGNVLVKEETMTQIADAIREKSGTDDLYKPEEMPEAILEISTYSGDGADPNKPVRFYDPYGELVYSYSVSEMEELTELPNLPEFAGLIGQEWNWSLENIKAVGGKVDVGANYITDDGATRIYITLLEGALNPRVGFKQASANSVYVDWGDGSNIETSEICGDEIVSIEHRYAKAGNYVIRLIPNEDAELELVGDYNSTKILHVVTENSYQNRIYGSAIRKIEIGKGMTEFTGRCFHSATIESVTIPKEIISLSTAFQGMRRLKCIVVPKAVVDFPSYAVRDCKGLKKIIFSESAVSLGGSSFAGCTSLEEIVLAADVALSYTDIFSDCAVLKNVVLPKSLKRMGSDLFSLDHLLEKIEIPNEVTSIGNGAFSHCDSLVEIEIPDSVTQLGGTNFYYCHALRKIKLSENLTAIPANMCYCCYSLSEVTIPTNVSEIETSAFGDCFGMKNYYILPKTPPVLGNINVFDDIPVDCKIHVPKGCLEAYQTAENWSEYADYMVEMEE